ncbi:MAG: valine--tRNA ligase [Candidatus Gracilibacteria bacterium]|nr:valine--tRNA ligase [Candidatus Gracilibacteria bacterium]
MEFSKKYNPSDFEKEIYKKWEDDNKFEPKKSKTGETFYIPMPPPNVTGNLHIGHSLTLTLEDIMVRYHRLKGDDTLWVPGTDHAGISTQTVVEKKLAKEGIGRVQLGREKFLDEVWKWKDEYQKNITGQMRLMGASCDWSKERFTFDEGLNKTVEHVFCDMYNRGLIYKGEYMVNYSPALQTVVSDIEVIYKEEQTEMYYITYFISGSDNELTIATTRPETLLADQAIAVHPKDKRYKKFIGRKVILPIVNKEIPIIGDESVEIEFGTGALKITPAHDSTDYQIGKKHNLKLDYRVIDANGYMTQDAGPFAGQDVKTARENIVELLKSKGNLLKKEPYVHKVGYCERTGCKIETIISTQWFVKSSELAKKVIEGYKKGDFVIIPDRFNKIFEDWIYNLRDWCISRQLWWGHQIPAYYDVKTGELVAVSQDEQGVYKKFGKENVRRDEDVLDTWFSSALWPFSILDWDPKNPSEMYKKYYPAQVLETGSDILFFWVTKMLLLGYDFTGETPFKTIYLNGLVLDEKGKKMSKSFGNVINPIEIIEKFSTDALRLSLVIGNTPGNNMNFSIDNVDNNQVFLNKFWNIFRFVFTNIGEINEDYNDLEKTITKNYSSLLSHEKWILSRLKNVVESTTEGMEKYNFSVAGADLTSFTKDEFADFYIEEYKLTKETSKHGNAVLAYSTLTLLKLWHPYIPFVTEELYGKLTSGIYLIDNSWPNLIDIKKDSVVEEKMGILYDIIRAIRNIRADKGVKPSDFVDIIFKSPNDYKDFLVENDPIIKGLAKVKEISIIGKDGVIENEKLSFGVVSDIDIFVDLGVNLDAEEEKERLKIQIDDKKEYIKIIDHKLLNNEFVKNAPENIVRSEHEKKRQAQEQLEKLLIKFNSL